MADNLRIVLFGAPASGKSSLHQALVLAATDSALTAEFIDCSGLEAQTLLSAQEELPADHPLAQALLGADAVILLIDVSSALNQEAPQLGEFLCLFQSLRGQRADIAGLPVHLVLSKCDLLAKSSETHEQWVKRIDDGKHKFEQRFGTILKEQGASPFGGVHLHLGATAVKQPVRADRPAQPAPFGVAELLAQVTASAQEFHDQREHAAGRLSLAVTGIFGLVAALGLLAGLLYLLRPSAELTALENQIRRVLPGSSTADRLREPLEERGKELGQIQESSQFARLPPKMQEEVSQARTEIEQYQKVQKDFLAQVSDPRFATRDEELDRIEKSLAAFVLPGDYLASWSETKLVRKMQQWQFDLQKLRAAAKDEESWMRGQVADAEKLKKQGGLIIAKSLPAVERDAWFKQVQEFLDREPRRKRTDRLADGASLTFDHVYRLQRIEQTRKSWDRTKESLKDLRKLAQ